MTTRLVRSSLPSDRRPKTSISRSFLGRIVLAASMLAAVSSSGRAAATEYEGFTEPYRHIEVTPAEPGVIAAIHVVEGESVKRGQTIAELDSRVLEATLAITKARKDVTGEVTSAKALNALRQSHLDKLLPLLARGHAQQDEVARAQADLAVAQANLRSAREQRQIEALEYERILAQLERRRMRSPFDGVVVRVYKEPAETVFGDGGPLMSLAQLNPLRIIVHAPTAAIAAIKAGDDVMVRFPDSEQSVTGRIELVSPVTDADSGTVRIKVLVENPDNQLRSGVRSLVSF